ncbi:MAG: hypothetical protein K0S99_533, partial [Thermomicrobiales bacterium]|nr:hypothetical protein [Thermomicrobiales bacterium]
MRPSAKTTRLTVTQESGGVGKEEEAVGLERSCELKGEFVAVDVDWHSCFTERRWGEHRRVAILQEESHQRGVEGLQCPRVVVAEDLALAVLGAAQDRLAPADGDAAVDGAQPDSVDAGGAKGG